MDLKRGLERGPFNGKEAEKLYEALTGLDSGQLQWLNGYFAGLSQATTSGTQTESVQHDASTQTATKQPPEKLNILFGSHTGNSEALADNLASAARDRGIEVEVSDMASFKARNLKKVKNLAVIVSTHGLGEPPIQAEDLYKYLHGKKAPNLSHVQFSVLALGDSSYVDFCQTGKDFDEVLEKLGARRIAVRQDCDVDYEDEAEAWQEKFLNELTQTSEEAEAAPQASETTATNGVKYSRKNLFEATILEKINLNGRGSSKETVHLELDLRRIWNTV